MNAPPSRRCFTWNIFGGSWNIAPQPGHKKKCELPGCTPARCGPVGSPSRAAAGHLREFGIHVHTSGIERAYRSLVNAHMGPDIPAPGPIPEFPFYNVSWNQTIPKCARNTGSDLPAVCLLHAAHDPRVPYLQVVHFHVHRYDIPFDLIPGRQAAQTEIG